MNHGGFGAVCGFGLHRGPRTAVPWVTRMGDHGTALRFCAPCATSHPEQRGRSSAPESKAKPGPGLRPPRLAPPQRRRPALGPGTGQDAPGMTAGCPSAPPGPGGHTELSVVVLRPEKMVSGYVKPPYERTIINYCKKKKRLQFIQRHLRYYVS